MYADTNFNENCAKNDLIKKSDSKLYFYENGYCLFKYNQIRCWMPWEAARFPDKIYIQSIQKDKFLQQQTYMLDPINLIFNYVNIILIHNGWQYAAIDTILLLIGIAVVNNMYCLWINEIVLFYWAYSKLKRKM